MSLFMSSPYRDAKLLTLRLLLLLLYRGYDIYMYKEWKSISFQKYHGNINQEEEKLRKTKNAMEYWGSVDIETPFLTSALDGGEWSALPSGKQPPVPIV
jgi:hypothetical protein